MDQDLTNGLYGHGGQKMRKNNGTIDRLQAVWNKLGGEEGIDALLRGEIEIVRVKFTEFIEFVGSVAMEIIGIFIATDKFVVNELASAACRIAYIGGDFEKWFLWPVYENVNKTPVFGVTKLYYYTFAKDISDGALVAALGGSKRAETSLVEVFMLMERQGNGSEGPLDNTGKWNLFYIKDTTGVLRLVSVHWSNGWCVNAALVTHDAPADSHLRSKVFVRSKVH